MNESAVLNAIYIISFKIYIYFIYFLAVSGLSCSTWNLGSSLQHAGSFTVAYELLVAAHGILFPDQGWNLGPLC